MSLVPSGTQLSPGRASVSRFQVSRHREEIWRKGGKGAGAGGAKCRVSEI